MKKRLDLKLVEEGLFPSREKAKAAIMAGIVFVDGERVDKAGTPVAEDGQIYIKGETCPYVSRGGLKLERALDIFSIDMEGCICIDMGASTGGFTDCMLKHGAKKVYAIDVGYGQLDYSLRTDERVVCMEKTNIRYLPEDAVPEKADRITIDVSFISLELILPVASRLLSPEGSIIALIKPQFEAGRNQVGKGGIVRDADIHGQVIEKVFSMAGENGLAAIDLTPSPITGAKGNIEYLVLLVEETERNTPMKREEILPVVEAAHAQLG